MMARTHQADQREKASTKSVVERQRRPLAPCLSARLAQPLEARSHKAHSPSSRQTKPPPPKGSLLFSDSSRISGPSNGTMPGCFRSPHQRPANQSSSASEASTPARPNRASERHQLRSHPPTDEGVKGRSSRRLSWESREVTKKM
jgi:hypothetical protein